MADKLNYKVGMIGALDMLRFKNMPKVREKAIQAASSAPLPKTLTTNEKAKQRHPEKQEVIVAEIRRNGATQRRSSSRLRMAPPSPRSEPGSTSAYASP